jgi:hypothetical protein
LNVFNFFKGIAMRKVENALVYENILLVPFSAESLDPSQEGVQIKKSYFGLFFPREGVDDLKSLLASGELFDILFDEDKFEHKFVTLDCLAILFSDMQAVVMEDQQSGGKFMANARSQTGLESGQAERQLELPFDDVSPSGRIIIT